MLIADENMCLSCASNIYIYIYIYYHVWGFSYLTRKKLILEFTNSMMIY